MKHTYIKEYQNVRIRPLDKADLEFLRNWRNNVENSKYLTSIPYITSEMQEKWYIRNLDDADEITFAIDEIDELRRVVGSLSLYNFETKKAEFGKILVGDNEAHGKNVGVNSIKAVLDIAFNELNLKEVYLHVYKNNKSAVNVYRKVGFVIVDEHITESGIELLMSIKDER